MNEQLLEESDANQPTAPATFSVRDEGSANWVVRRVTEARAYAAKAAAWAEDETRRACREEEWFLRRFGGELREWTRTELEVRGGRSKSIKLPAGQIGFRSVPAAVQLVDLSSLEVWSQEHLPAALRIRVVARGVDAKSLLALIAAHQLAVAVDREVLATEVRKYVVATGELPPGSLASAADEVFYVK